MQLKFTPLAQMDLETIGDYIAEDDPRRAVTFVRELRDQCYKICRFPQGYRLRIDITENIRSSVYGRYVIYFAVEGNNVKIVRILHGAMDASAYLDT